MEPKHERRKSCACKQNKGTLPHRHDLRRRRRPSRTMTPSRMQPRPIPLLLFNSFPALVFITHGGRCGRCRRTPSRHGGVVRCVVLLTRLAFGTLPRLRGVGRDVSPTRGGFRFFGLGARQVVCVAFARRAAGVVWSHRAKTTHEVGDQETNQLLDCAFAGK
jgi:hypothetical protein